MIKCNKGKMEISGMLIDVIGELMTLTRAVSKHVAEQHDDVLSERFKQCISDAVAIGFGEKTIEEVFGSDDDDDDPVDATIDELIDTLKRIKGKKHDKG